jgi:hypothetical protein
MSPIPWLDPDIAMWPAVIVSIWPFTGHPTTGIWPVGWFGIDNVGQPWVCTVAGSPGTWAEVGFSSAGVISFNTRTGAVVLTAADIEALFTAQGQLFAGSGSGTGGLVTVGADGTVLTASAAATDGMVWQYPPLTNAAGHLATDYDLTTNLATFLTTASLAAGTWHIRCGINWNNALGGNILQAVVNEGTATATFAGKTSAELSSTLSQVRLDATLDFEATITGAGTLVFQAIANTTTDTPIIYAETSGSYGTPTGYTAVRIA